ncbi:MAG: pilus assembly protein PilM [Myxococcota bacterium]
MRVPGLRLFGRSSETGLGPIGFDLGCEQLHMLQLEREHESLRVRAAASRPYPGGRDAILSAPAGLKSLVAEALRSQPFRGRKVVTVIPGDVVKLMVLNYELAPQQSEPELILSLVKERIKEPLDEWVVDYHPIRPSHEKQSELSALVAMAREDVVVKYLELLRMAGLEVEALEIPPVAIRRLVTRLALRDFEEDVMILHFGRDRSHLTVLWGRRLILYRELEFGEDRAVEQVAKSLDLPQESAASLLLDFGVFPDAPGAGLDRASAEICETVMEILTPAFAAVAEQIGNALIYTASRTRGASVDLIYLVGSIARWPGIDQLISSLAAIPVRILDPLQAITARPDARLPDAGESAPGIVLAASLALRGFGDGE